MLTGRILLPASITVTMTAGVDGFALGLTARAGVRTIAVAGTGGGLLTLQYPCMAAAIRASTRSVSAGTVALCHICSYILYIMAGIALIVCCMALRGMGNFNVSSLERILSARRAVADNRAGRSDGNARRTHGSTDCWSRAEFYSASPSSLSAVRISFSAYRLRPDARKHCKIEWGISVRSCRWLAF